MVNGRKTAILRRVLRTLRALLAVSIPLVAIYSFWPARPVAPTAKLEGPPIDSKELPPTADHEFSWYSPLWTRNLKEPPTPKVTLLASSTPPSAANLPVLLATLVEPDGKYAHFASASGPPQLRGLEEMIDNFKIKDIEPGRVQLEAGERLLWVELPKPKN